MNWKHLTSTNRTSRCSDDTWWEMAAEPARAALTAGLPTGTPQEAAAIFPWPGVLPPWTVGAQGTAALSVGRWAHKPLGVVQKGTFRWRWKSSLCPVSPGVRTPRGQEASPAGGKVTHSLRFFRFSLWIPFHSFTKHSPSACPVPGCGDFGLSFWRGSVFQGRCIP